VVVLAEVKVVDFVCLAVGVSDFPLIWLASKVSFPVNAFDGCASVAIGLV